VTVTDAGTPLPSGLDQDALLKHLEPLARAGRIFFLLDDDPVGYRIELFADEPVPSTFAREFEPAGGAFRLEAQSGRVVVSGWDQAGQPGEAGGLTVSPGAYLVSVSRRRPFDGTRHAEDMSELLGADWKLMQRVNSLGLLGCLPMVVTGMILLARRWHWLWYAVPALALSWMPYVVLKRTRRYRAAEERAAEFERARPHYVLTFTPARDDAVSGGFLRA
jgi:hypothetical protein